jgi:hypothetical protein
MVVNSDGDISFQLTANILFRPVLLGAIRAEAIANLGKVGRKYPVHNFCIRPSSSKTNDCRVVVGGKLSQTKGLEKSVFFC